MKRTLLVFSILAILMLACQMTGLTPLPPTSSTPVPNSQVQTSPPVLVEAARPIPEEGSLSELYQAVLPGVVTIFTDTGLGSGFVFDGEGHVITNNHVVEGASAVEVDFASGFKAHGTVIGTDPDADIAVIRVDAPADQIHPLPIGDSNNLLVGQSVVAIGNPFGLDGTMTLGIISGLGRTQEAHAAPEGGGRFSTADVIQTDAAINPGNSGGPLFNLNGEVVGVNQSIRTNNVDPTTGNAVNSGVGFSISINLVKRIVPVLIRNGKYEYPYLGISSRELSLGEIESLGLNTYTGAFVADVVPGGPADQAGIRGGEDIITGIDGIQVISFDDMLSYLALNKAPGDTVVLTVLRAGQPVDVTVTLGTRP